MNKYILAIHDDAAWETWIATFHANSISECEDKIEEYFADYFDRDDLMNLNYSDFREELDELNISISEIEDAETL